MKRSIIVAVTSVALLAFAAAPALAQYPPDAPECALEATVVAPGTAVVVTCVGWAANSSVLPTIFSEPRVLDPISTDAQGKLTAPVPIPADLTPGDHTLRLAGKNTRGEDTHIDLPFTVVAAGSPDRAGVVPAPGGDRGLPRTGAQVLMLTGAAALLLGVGTASLVVARRQRKRLNANA